MTALVASDVCQIASRAAVLISTVPPACSSSSFTFWASSLETPRPMIAGTDPTNVSALFMTSNFLPPKPIKLRQTRSSQREWQLQRLKTSGILRSFTSNPVDVGGAAAVVLGVNFESR